MVINVQQAKGDVCKAEQKMVKARLDYEVASTRLRTLEEELNKMRSRNS